MLDNKDWLYKMTRKKLNEYVSKVSKLLNDEKDPKNIAIYSKWKDEALAEIERRNYAKANYINNMLNKKSRA